LKKIISSQKIEEMHETNDVLGLLKAMLNRNPEKPPDKFYWAIEEALIDIGHRSTTPFVKLINDKDILIRRGVLWSLMKIRDINTVDLLIGAITDDDENVRDLAVHALGEFGDERALGPLNNLREGTSTSYKESISSAITSINSRVGH
jgi:HEAT repeat protein